MGRELELKYRADNAVFTALQQRFGNFQTIIMETSYFDTPEGDLEKRKWMLRRRLENRRAVCTLKTPLPDGSRGEWETEGVSIQEAVSALCKLGCPQELEAFVQKGLVETCTARFTRQAALIELEQGTAELALDQGVFLGWGQEQPFQELEVEYKSGREEATLAFAASLADQFHLVPETKSKVQRALALREIQKSQSRDRQEKRL